ncbi:MAG: hypothetical protein ACKV22_01985 [Bryobacteraceae bacterium]
MGLRPTKGDDKRACSPERKREGPFPRAKEFTAQERFFKGAVAEDMQMRAVIPMFSSDFQFNKTAKHYL